MSTIVFYSALLIIFLSPYHLFHLSNISHFLFKLAMLKLFLSVYLYLINYYLLPRNILSHRMNKSVVLKRNWLVEISQLVSYFIISISAKDIRYGIMYMKLIRKYFLSRKFKKQNQLVLLLSLGQIETLMQFDCLLSKKDVLSLTIVLIIIAF